MKTKDEINAFLGVNTEFDGTLTFTGAVRIDGHFRGEISSGGTLIVGERAVIESDVHASHIIVNGEIRGNVIAEERMEIHTSGKVTGNIQTPVLVINEGVIFNGNCRMEKAEKIKDKVLPITPEESLPGPVLVRDAKIKELLD